MRPPTPDPAAEREDLALVSRARDGEREALDGLVRRHQPWIHNVALRMLGHPQDAEDATQEILVRALGRLASFEGRSAFRTWLYRIAVNSLLNTRRGRREAKNLTFGCYAHGLEATPDLDPPDQASVPADVHLLVAEARISCTAGMLLCLDRQQRIAYVLGEIFGVTDTLGGEILEITPETFRQRLARARRDLHSFMNERCGLANPANPCRCERKTRGFIEAGWVDPTRLVFATEHLRTVSALAPAAAAGLTALDRRCGEIFRQHPSPASPDLVPAVRRLLESADFHRTVSPL
jgi:RNA polymerase sigma factor (sigma-70 family)